MTVRILKSGRYETWSMHDGWWLLVVQRTLPTKVVATNGLWADGVNAEIE